MDTVSASPGPTRWRSWSRPLGIYLAFLVLIRIVGQRALATMSSFDFAAAVALGAVMGRVVLGYMPTLVAGVVGLVTLFALQAAFGRLRRVRRIDRAISNLPVLLMANGRVMHVPWGDTDSG